LKDLLKWADQEMNGDMNYEIDHKFLLALEALFLELKKNPLVFQHFDKSMSVGFYHMDSSSERVFDRQI
jgi:hypothetical protein